MIECFEHTPLIETQSISEEAASIVLTLQTAPSEYFMPDAMSIAHSLRPSQKLPVLTTTELKNRCLAELKAARTLRLVDLTQSGTLFRLGADARLFSGDHTISQAWSKALYDHPFNIDGLLYPSRLDPARHALALFEGRATLVELNRQTWFATGPLRHVLAEIVEHYALAVIEEKVIPPRKPTSSAIQERLK
jgi:hypothetical protein